jgi:import receptor subunit TOM70
MGNAPEALSDMDKSTRLDPKFTQTWIKKASVHMEVGKCDKRLCCSLNVFDSAM